MMKFISRKDWLKLLYKEVTSVFNEKLPVTIFNAKLSFQEQKLYILCLSFTNRTFLEVIVVHLG